MNDFAGVKQQVMAHRDLRVVFTQCQGGLRLPDHQHQHAFLSFLIDGDYLEGQSSRMQPCRPNDLIWHPPGDRHEVQHGPDLVQSLQFEFTGHEFEGLDLRKLPASRTTKFIPQVRQLITEVRTEMNDSDSYTNAAVRGRLLQLLAALGRELDHHRLARGQWMAAVRDAFEREFPAQPDIELLAESLGMTPTQLCSAYRQQCGQSLKQGWQDFRLRQVCKKLLDSDMPLAQVALECGYYDQSHFTHSFSRVMKCTPSAFRRR